MKKLMLCTVVALVAAMVWAQNPSPAQTVAPLPGDISGIWQGTLVATPPDPDIRTLVKITKGDKGAWNGTMYRVDQPGFAVPATSVSLQGKTFTFAIPQMEATFEGKLSVDGGLITGTWTHGPTTHVLNLLRVGPDAAWEIPAPPEPPKQLPADADPSFEVATIKPNPSGAPALQRLTTNGHDFTVRNASLGDLISFAYDVQMNQLVGGPSWMDQDRYDLDARQDQDGLGSDKQLRNMMRKLLEDRFQLKIHRDKRELPAFVLSVAKSGEKLTPTQSKGPLPGMGFRPATGGVMLGINNGTTGDLADFLQSAVLDRPVVNHTNISGRFDINVRFMPDDSQFKGHPPKVPAETDTTETAPSLFNAIEQQLGLKLSAEKTAVNVIAIDHVEKPSAN